jgi:hypothetical protein
MHAYEPCTYAYCSDWICVFSWARTWSGCQTSRVSTQRCTKRLCCPASWSRSSHARIKLLSSTSWSALSRYVCVYHMQGSNFSTKPNRVHYSGMCHVRVCMHACVVRMYGTRVCMHAPLRLFLKTHHVLAKHTIHTHIQTCMHTETMHVAKTCRTVSSGRVHTYIHTDTQHNQTYVYIYMHTCILRYSQVFPDEHHLRTLDEILDIYIYIYIYIHTHIHTYSYTHAWLLPGIPRRASFEDP